MDDEDVREQKYRQMASAISPAIVRLAGAVEADRARRDELIQEIHLQLWRSLRGFGGQCSERTWALRVAHNVAASHVDAEIRRRLKTVPIEDVEPPSDGLSPCDLLDRRRATAEVGRLVRALPPLDRQLLLLYLEGLSAPEIAEIAGISANAVSIRMHRVRTLLARRFSGGDS